MPHRLIPFFETAAGPVLSITSLLGAVTTATVESQLINGIGNWPVTSILGAVCIYSLWLSHKRAREHESAMLKVIEMLKEKNQ